MKASLYLFFIFYSLQLFSQDYESSILQYRQEKKEYFLKAEFGPLKKDQVDLLRYFPIEERYKITAKVDFLFGESSFRMPTYDGTSTEYIKYAVLNFKVDEQEFKVPCYKNVSLLKDPKHTDHLFFPFKDDTNGEETYEGGRYLDLNEKDIKNGTIVLDFNKAYNPYCAYSNGYRCPVPPFENHIKTAIFAGEQIYKGRKNERQVNKKNAENFSTDEKDIILSGNVTDRLHVYQITDEKELAVLKNTSQDIHPDDPLLKILAARMLATVQDPEHTGVGIAAPQVGINKNLIWVQRFDKSGNPFEFYINPKIIWRSRLSRKGAEGCLSIPDRKEEIERSYAIRIQYRTEDGHVQEENIEGFTAVIFQHEIDHLFGILYPDRLDEQSQNERIPLNEKIPFSIERGNIIP